MSDKDDAKQALEFLGQLVAGLPDGEKAVQLASRYTGELRRQASSAKEEATRQAEENASLKQQYLQLEARVQEQLKQAEQRNRELDELQKKFEQLTQAAQSGPMVRPRLGFIHHPSDYTRPMTMAEEGRTEPPYLPQYHRVVMLGERTKPKDVVPRGSECWGPKPNNLLKVGERLDLGSPLFVARPILEGKPRDRDFTVVFAYIRQFIEERGAELCRLQIHHRRAPDAEPVSEQASVCLCCGAHEEIDIVEGADRKYHSRMTHRHGCWILQWRQALSELRYALDLWLSIHGDTTAIREGHALLVKHSDYYASVVPKLWQKIVEDAKDGKYLAMVADTSAAVTDNQQPPNDSEMVYDKP